MYTLLNTARTNPISLEYKIKNDIMFSLFPQGWSFFTKDPTESRMTLYKIENNKLIAINFKNTQSHNFYGLTKSDRIFYYKIYNEMGNIPLKHFFNTRENAEKMDLSKLNKYKVFNTNFRKGLYVAQIQKITPWAWHSELDNVSMPKRCIILNIQ